jgi:hypothetical protein
LAPSFRPVCCKFRLGVLVDLVARLQAAGCDDPKQNTFENLAKLKKLDMVGLAKAKGVPTGGLTKVEPQVKT